MRIGHGYDVHRFAEDRQLILGGIQIPWEKGLLGHSDADVLVHALMDAILGAAALGDIGQHFPDSSDEFKDISSLVLLKRCMELLNGSGYGFVNADITVIAQAPKLAPHIPAMRKTLCEIIGCDLRSLNIKATTEEGLGFTGKGEGIACHAVCLIEEK